MTIRTFAWPDLPEVCALIQKELGYPVVEEELKDRLLQMEKEKNYQTLVALDGERVVGFIGLQSSLAFEVSGRIVRILVLAVKESEQQKGIGKQLVQKAEEYAQKERATAIFLNSGFQRTGAHQFYERQGYRKKGYNFYKVL